jgi:hypothetical protein
MFDRLSDKAVRVLLERGKKLKGAAPFIRSPRGMIALREEGYRRGVVVGQDTKLLAVMRKFNV